MTVRVEKNSNLILRNLTKTIWDEFVYGGHFLALGDAVALYVMAVILSISVTWSFLVVIYLCVFAANLFNRSDESVHDRLTNPIRLKVMKKYSDNFYPIVLVCLVVSASLVVIFSGINALILASLIFVVAILYTTLFKKMTRYIVGFKSYVAAFFYALMVFLLVIYYKAPINTAVILIFIFYYMRIFISNAACDVKDIESDKRRGLKTLAISLGEDTAMGLLNFINICSGLIIIFGVVTGILPSFSLGLLLTVPYASYYFYFNSKMDAKEAFTNAIVDGEFLLWLPFILLGKVFL